MPRNWTPSDIEDRFDELSKQMDEAVADLEDAENDYHVCKANFEIDIARERLNLLRTPGVKMTVGEREDEALTRCEDQRRSLGAAEARVRAARANIGRINVQVDLARSMSTSIRTSIDMTS